VNRIRLWDGLALCSFESLRAASAVKEQELSRKNAVRKKKSKKARKQQESKEQSDISATRRHGETREHTTLLGETHGG